MIIERENEWLESMLLPLEGLYQWDDDDSSEWIQKWNQLNSESIQDDDDDGNYVTETQEKHWLTDWLTYFVSIWSAADREEENVCPNESCLLSLCICVYWLWSWSAVP